MNGKINSLWTLNSNKLKKLSDSQKSGAGLNDTYKPKWAHLFETNLISLLQTNLINVNIEFNTTIFDSENVSN